MEIIYDIQLQSRQLKITKTLLMDWGSIVEYNTNEIKSIADC